MGDRGAADEGSSAWSSGRLIRKALGENFLLDRLAPFLSRLGETDLDHLARVVPLIDRRADIEPLIALETV